MQIEVLGASGGETPECWLTSLLINDRLALDAGCLTRALSLERQSALRSIVISHPHVDHIYSLPFFIENVYRAQERAVAIYGSASTLEAVRRHLLNDVTWPDFTRLPSQRRPAVRFHEIVAGQAFELEEVVLTPIPVQHPLPTFGFLLEDGRGHAVLWSSDTGPTEELWRWANRARGLELVCLETSFDNALQDLADVSQHLTPHSMALELAKLKKEVPVLLHHLKPASQDRIRQEVEALAEARLGFLEQGRTYTVG
jgi:ribonuclease BN (tRNA processing enzyme)